MIEFLNKLFHSDFMAHGYCYRWQPDIMWLHAVSDGIIAASYYFIPLVLVYLVRKRKDLPFHWVFIMFGIFILSCGTTHVMEIWTLWHGTYRLAGLIKAVTAGASMATAAALIPLVPKALLLPSPSQLRLANQELEREVAERRRVEQALQLERNFVSAVLNTVETAILVLDHEGKIVQCNQAFGQMSGVEKSELPGRIASSLFQVQEERQHFQRFLGQLQEGSRANKFECYWSTPGGHARLIAWSAAPLPDSAGNPHHLILSGIDITEATRLQKTVLDISGREQARIAIDLHDDLGQHLTGMILMSTILERKLSTALQPEATEAASIVAMTKEAIQKTKDLSRGLLPVGSESRGLTAALERWSGEVQGRSGIPCRFICEEPILIGDEKVATHLFRIAQEGVNNAIKHGRPKRIDIRVARSDASVDLSIEDDGIGISNETKSNEGLGLQIMSYRAKMIGGILQVERGPKGGTIVNCHLPSEASLSDN